MSSENRTDRILIGIALIILLLAGGLFYFDDWMWGSRSRRGEAIGEIATQKGDVRVKFEGELKWQRASRGQDLIYNDAIYSGESSEAQLALGESKMTVSENTLIIIRRENKNNFLNLNYGTLFGSLAKNEKILIDTGDGRPVELSTEMPTEIVLRKVNGVTELDVVSGQAQLVVDGKKKKIRKASRVDLKTAKARVKPVELKIIKPLKEHVLYSEASENIDFQWAWQPPHKPAEEDVFTLEFSEASDFQKVHFQKLVTGKLNSRLKVSKSLSLFYRIRGPKGELSTIEKVNFVRLHKPVILKPVAGSKIITPKHQSAVVEFQFKRPSDATVWYQIAQDPDFNANLVNQNSAEQLQLQELPVGQYFVRARTDYSQGKLSEWTDPVPFSIEPKLELMRLSSVPDRSRILIPNVAYPSRLYSAPSPMVSSYLHRKGILKNYFPDGDFDDMKLTVNGQTKAQQDRAWPAQHIYPGHYKFEYEITKEGFLPVQSGLKEVEIAMEPPKALGEVQFSDYDSALRREARWKFTPILFAAAYDVQLARDPSFGKALDMNVRSPQAAARLGAGDYFWRVRARDKDGRIISRYSAANRFQVAQRPINFLARNKREPQAVEKTTTRVKTVKEQYYEESGWWAWLGSGANYVEIRQSIPGRGTLTSQNSKGPSQYVETGYNGKSGWGGMFSYNSTPGELVIDGVQLANAKYTWSTLSLEGILRKTAPFNVIGNPVVYGLRAGVQQHKTPFVFLDSQGVPRIKDNEMRTASVGLLAEMERHRWIYYWLMRYQFPFSSSSPGAAQFELTPTFGFDGSLGAAYHFTKQLKLGLFWYGQWHQYDFIYGDVDVTNAGFQSLFYSAIDIRLGLDF